MILMSEIMSETENRIPEAKSKLAQMALHQVPAQMVSYMHSHNIAAKPPIQVRKELFKAFDMGSETNILNVT